MTPAELRALTAVGLANKNQRLEKERQEEEQKAREARQERANREHMKAKQIISTAEVLFERLANDGVSTCLVYALERDDYFRSDYYSDTCDVKSFNLKGAAKIIWDHCKQAGFEMAIYEQHGPYDPEGPTSSTYYIRVSW